MRKFVTFLLAVAVLAAVGCAGSSRSEDGVTRIAYITTIVSVRAVSGRATVPQVFIGGKHIGGSDDLEAYFAK